MNPQQKYQSPEPVKLAARKWADRQLEHAPQYMSVDLRDGNQALPEPLSPAEKLEFFHLLCRVGFTEIEVAYPSASQADFAFTRELITGGHIPANVRIAALAPLKKELIAKTFDALADAKNVLLHLYIAVSDLHLNTVFNLSRDEVLTQAVEATKYAKQLVKENPQTDFRYEFSPEEFTDADPDYALAVCRAVVETWGDVGDKKMILNLPATVERRSPHQFADLIEYFCDKFPYRDRVIISLHPHNDQGMAIAAAEMGLLAGADRLEGTLFGNGERTGNLDLITFAGNLLARGIDPQLDLSDLPTLVAEVKRIANLSIYPRLPYSGDLVFTAFSGTHQDAIRKGMSARADARWHVPYLLVDPQDFGRSYEQLIRLNTQSGKGGAAWVLEHNFGIKLPKEILPELGRTVQKYLDQIGGELSPTKLQQIFSDEFVTPAGPYEIVGYWPNPDADDPGLVHGVVKLKIGDRIAESRADGNGPVSAFVNAVQKITPEKFSVVEYQEAAIDKGTNARALACVTLSDAATIFYGVGIHTNITQATVRAIVSALNRRCRDDKNA